MFVAFKKKIVFLCDTITFDNILYGDTSDKVHIFNQPINDEPTNSLGIKAEYTPRAVVQLVNIFNSHPNDWTLKDECKVTTYMT
jgi:hypothetical protein